MTAEERMKSLLLSGPLGFPTKGGGRGPPTKGSTAQQGGLWPSISSAL